MVSIEICLVVSFLFRVCHVAAPVLCAPSSGQTANETVRKNRDAQSLNQCQTWNQMNELIHRALLFS
jgi:hypothetical protein